MGLQLHLCLYGGLWWEVAMTGIAMTPLYMPVLLCCLADFSYLKVFLPSFLQYGENQTAYGKIDNGVLNT